MDYQEEDNMALSDLEICIVERKVLWHGSFGGRQPHFYIVKTIVGELGCDEVD
jgi:hypothetical protein